MANQFSDVNFLNIVFMFEYNVYCNTQILTDVTNVVFTRIIGVLIQCLDD